MDNKVKAKSDIDMEKFRLRRFVDRLIEHGHVTIHPEPDDGRYLQPLEGMIKRQPPVS